MSRQLRGNESLTFLAMWDWESPLSKNCPSSPLTDVRPDGVPVRRENMAPLAAGRLSNPFEDLRQCGSSILPQRA